MTRIPKVSSVGKSRTQTRLGRRRSARQRRNGSSQPRPSIPVINHLTLMVDRDLLRGSKRDSLRDFYHSVFGWKEIPQLTEDGKHLVFLLYQRGHFLNLLSGPPVSRMKGHEHLGFELPRKTDLKRIVERAKRFKKTRDSAVEISEIRESVSELERPPWRLSGVYVHYLLPMKIELQYHEVVRR